MKFHSGDFNLEDEERGRPKVQVNSDKVKALIEIKISQIAHDLSVKSYYSNKLDYVKPVHQMKKLGRCISKLPIFAFTTPKCIIIIDILYINIIDIVTFNKN